MNSKKKSEKNACDAFIEILQKITGVTYKEVDRPDEKNSVTQDIDFILNANLENARYPKIAVEHTIIEAHEKQKEYVNQLNGIEKEIDQKCQGKLPIDSCFNLSAPLSLIAGMNKRKKAQFVEEMSSWIPYVAKSLTTNQQSSRIYNKHKVTLWCIGSFSEFNGTIGMISLRPEDSRRKRQDRFRRAIEDKLPKLMKYKEIGFATALLLEDISLSHLNPGGNLKDLIPDQYHSEFYSKIDYVIIFFSRENKMFRGHIWKEESKIYSEIPYNRMFRFHQ